MASSAASRSKLSSNAMSSTLRCLRVLDILAEPPYELSLTEIVARLKMVKGSAHRMVRTLCEAGLVEQDVRSRLYRLSPKSFWVGTAFLRHSAVYQAALPLMHSMMERAGGMAHLAAWHERALMYLHTISQPGESHLFAEIGERWPLHCTGLGKAMLAYREPREIDLLFAVERTRFTANTITTGDAMKREVARIRARGYAVDDEEMVQGVRCVAAPIFQRDGLAVAAVSVSAPTSLLTDQRIAECAAIVCEAALRTSMQLGFRPPVRE
ncbi:MAG: helix-turn-helix domain-containing protein [Acidobacteria bacterium]|nr:helix-turn-helix domain-containing protein [Acidobacteriota bacterium]